MQDPPRLKAKLLIQHDTFLPKIPLKGTITVSAADLVPSIFRALNLGK